MAWQLALPLQLQPDIVMIMMVMMIYFILSVELFRIPRTLCPYMSWQWRLAGSHCSGVQKLLSRIGCRDRKGWMDAGEGLQRNFCLLLCWLWLLPKWGEGYDWNTMSFLFVNSLPSFNILQHHTSFLRSLHHNKLLHIGLYYSDIVQYMATIIIYILYVVPVGIH
jgi:hypothetical protein